MRIVVRTFSDFSVKINFYEIADKLETVFCNKYVLLSDYESFYKQIKKRKLYFDS